MSTISHRERAAGVHPLLQALLDAWAQEGTHDIVVAPNGGVRRDAALQRKLAAAGSSNATSLSTTPHGRAAALDVWPASFLPFVPTSAGGTGPRWVAWEALPQQVRDEFRAFGEFAERRAGFRWGGRFRGANFPNGDQPHVELSSWAALPFPPPIYG